MSIKTLKYNSLLGPEQTEKEPLKQKQRARFQTVNRLSTIFRPYTWYLVLVILAILASTALNLVIPLLIPLVIDNALTNRNVQLLLIYAIIMSSAAIGSGMIGVGQTYLGNLVGQRVMRDLRNKLYAHLQEMSLSFFTSMHTGEILSRLSNDVGSAQVAVTDTFISLITNTIVFAGTVAVMFYLSPWLTLVLFIFLPVFIFLAVKVGGSQRKSLKATQQSLAELTTLMQETLSIGGILLIKTFARKHYALQRFEAKNERLMLMSLRHQMLGRWFVMFISTFMTLIPVILYVIAGFLLIYDRADITIGTLVAFVTTLGRFFGPFNQLSTALVNAQGSLALFERIFEYLDRAIEIKDRPDALHLAATQVRGELVFKQVSFDYKRYHSDSFVGTNNQPILSPDTTRDTPLEECNHHVTLQDLSFTVKPGQLVALVGPSGAGKTTITYLISRLYDAEKGVIEIDGHNIKNIALESLGAMIGTVTQETYLLHASIRENLLFVRPEATEEELIAAAQAASIHERIMELDNGYDTIVGERGYNLSGGEKQRIAIARVLLKNTRILLLDEATSSLDTSSERLIQQTLEPLMRGRTTIAIAHRLSTILAADLILVLDRGKIVERGTHQELLKHGGLYARLYNQQFVD